jgi:N12 class adenine-specific DNA methylase
VDTNEDDEDELGLSDEEEAASARKKICKVSQAVNRWLYAIKCFGLEGLESDIFNSFKVFALAHRVTNIRFET